MKFELSEIKSTQKRWLCLIPLFIYFGFIIIPQWFSPFSLQQKNWLLALPFVLLVLAIIGIWGGIGLWQAKTGRISYNPMHKFFVQITGISLTWFGISVVLACGTHYAYNHQEFDAESWQSYTAVPYEYPSIRQRMIDDVVKNVLPGRTKNEIISLLGPQGEPPSSDNKSIHYMLGPAQEQRSPDVCEVLDIDFNEAGYFQKYSFHNECGHG